MESQTKPTPKGTQGSEDGGYDARAAASAPTQLLVFVLRVLAVVLTLISAVVMGAAKQTVTIAVPDPTGFQSVMILSSTAKSTYSSAFIYFIVANSIAFVYSTLSLVVSIANRRSSGNLLLPLCIVDLVMVALLFSSDGAATAFGVVAEKGNSHAGWAKFCDSVGKFCGHVVASIVLSMFASVAYVLIAMLGIIGIHKRSQ